MTRASNTFAWFGCGWQLTHKGKRRKNNLKKKNNLSFTEVLCLDAWKLFCQRFSWRLLFFLVSQRAVQVEVFKLTGSILGWSESNETYNARKSRWEIIVFNICKIFILNSILIADLPRDEIANVDIGDQLASTCSTSLRAKAIHLGTYRSEPLDDIMFTSQGIRLTVSGLIRASVVLNIHKREIVRIVYHLSSKCCVMFIYVMSSCSRYVCSEIGLKPDKKSKFGYQSAFIHDKWTKTREIAQIEINLTFDRWLLRIVYNCSSRKANHHPTGFDNGTRQRSHNGSFSTKCARRDKNWRCCRAARTSDNCSNDSCIMKLRISVAPLRSEENFDIYWSWSVIYIRQK